MRRSARKHQDERWWLKPQRNLPRAVIYTAVVVVTAVTQVAAYKLVMATSPKAWDYSLPRDRAITAFADSPTAAPSPTSPVLVFAATDPEVIGSPLPTTLPSLLPTTAPTPTPTPTPTISFSPRPSPTPTASTPITITMSADRKTAKPGDVITYAIKLSSRRYSGSVDVTSRIPPQTESEWGCIGAAGSSPGECDWSFTLDEGSSRTLEFAVKVQSTARRDIENASSAYAGSYNAISNKVTVAVESNVAIGGATN